MTQPPDSATTTIPAKTAPVPFWNRGRIMFWLGSVVIMAMLVGLLLPATRNARGAAYRTQCQSNVHQIEMALVEYYDKHGQTPPLFTTDEDGQPLHSWRTLLLPYLGYESLYAQIDLTKPWDDPIHAELRRSTPIVFECKLAQLEPGQSNYLANIPNWPARLWISDSTPTGSDTDGTDVIVFEVDQTQAVEWMSPYDGHYLDYRATRKEGPLLHDNTHTVLETGGHVQSVKLDLADGLDHPQYPQAER